MNRKVKSFKQTVFLSEQCAMSKVITSVWSAVFQLWHRPSIVWYNTSFEVGSEIHCSGVSRRCYPMTSSDTARLLETLAYAYTCGVRMPPSLSRTYVNMRESDVLRIWGHCRSDSTAAGSSTPWSAEAGDRAWVARTGTALHCSQRCWMETTSAVMCRGSKWRTH